MATAPIRHLAWEPPYAAGAAQEIATTTKDKKTKDQKTKDQKKKNSDIPLECQNILVSILLFYF